MSAATLIITASPNPEKGEAAQQYIGQALPMLIAAGGENLRRARVIKPVIGEAKFSATLIMDFPSADAIERMFSSDEYAAISPLREEGFFEMNILIGEPQ